MNLIIDVGNTFVKLAVFKTDTLVFKTSVELLNTLLEIKQLKNNFPKLKKAIVSSVGALKEEQLATIKTYFNVLILTHKTKLPFKNEYATPHTLGIDRIALVSAAVYQYSKKNVLIIDAGTCITYDFLSNNNQYFGGAISPGIRMRYASLHNLTANLPLLNTETPKTIIGNTTNAAIHSGVINGVINEIDGFIKTYQDKYLDLTVILTGGDANFLSEQLKSSIFANSNFLLEGLNYILKFNSN